jgi:putative chitinase
MIIIPATLRQIIPATPSEVAEIAAPRLDSACRKMGIDTPLELAHFLAQVGHESGFRPIEENLNYSAKGLVKTWPTRYTPATAAVYERQPERIANHSYANRYGNGSEASGDGWRYRGRGAFQLTFRDNYRNYGRLLGYDLEGMPDLAKQYGVGALVAALYWKVHGFDRYANRDDLRTITIAINGGTNGIDDRYRLLALAKAALKIAA